MAASEGGSEEFDIGETVGKYVAGVSEEGKPTVMAVSVFVQISCRFPEKSLVCHPSISMPGKIGDPL